jgi:hypothetical protein
MLTPDLITREELYEAVWTESVQKLAASLGISDVGLAKICRKLGVPRPGRGYWAKSRGARKLLKKPLPPLHPDQVESHRVSLDAIEGGSAWTREALQHLAEENIPVPKAVAPPTGELHPLIAAHRNRLAESGFEIRQLLAGQACLAVSVSKALLDRSLALFQRIFAAFEAKGYQPEVLPPNPRGRSMYGHEQAQPSRTGVRIKGIYVAFELREDYRIVEVPAPVPELKTGKRPTTFELPPGPTYRKVGTGELTLEIVDPTPYGMHKRWQDGKVRTIEASLDRFFRAVMAIAEHQCQEELERERQRQEKAEAERRAQEQAAR